MKRLEGYKIEGSQDSDGERPDLYMHVDETGVEMRRDGSRALDEFKCHLTLDEARQLSVALIELLPKATEDHEDDDIVFP